MRSSRWVVVWLGLATGCFSTSSYQSARMLPAGTTRVSAAVGSYEGHISSTSTNSSGSQGEDALEAMASYGVSDQLELGAKLSWIAAEANVFHLLAVPKLSLIPDTLAVVVPFGTMIVGDSDLNGDGMTDPGGHLFELLPGVIYSHRLHPYFELDTAAQVLWTINDQFDDSELYGGGNLGVRIGPMTSPWSVQPELGLITPLTHRGTGNVSYIMEFGIAVHYELGGSRAPVASAP